MVRVLLEETRLPFVEAPAPADRPHMLMTDPDGPEGVWRTNSLDSTLCYLARKSGLDPNAVYRGVGWSAPLEDFYVGRRHDAWEWSEHTLQVEEDLGQQDYMRGAFSIDDIKVYGCRRGELRKELPAEKFPNIHRWLARMAARPIVARHLPD